MIDFHTFIAFAVSSLLLIATPGPNMIFIISRSIGYGRREGIVSALGVDSGSVIHVIAAVVGLSALLASSAVAFQIIKYLGAAYLIYLGIRVLLSPAQSIEGQAVADKSLRQVYYQGVITNVLNPKAAIFFLAFFPQFVDASKGSVTIQILYLGVVFILLGVIVDIIVALISGTISGWLRSNTGFWRIQKYVSGCIYIALGLSAALVGPKNSQ